MNSAKQPESICRITKGLGCAQTEEGVSFVKRAEEPRHAERGTEGLGTFGVTRLFGSRNEEATWASSARQRGVGRVRAGSRLLHPNALRFILLIERRHHPQLISRMPPIARGMLHATEFSQLL